MNLDAEKKLLKKELDEINDVELIHAIKQLLRYAKFSREEKALKPFTKAQLIKRAKISERDIKAGRTTELSSLRKEILKW
jgi:hypothetical protein